MAKELNLTEAQQAQAKAIFDDARAQAQPLHEQLRNGHKAIADAVKANKSDAELQQLADAQGDVMGRLAGIHARAFARFYANLTPEQKAKADELHTKMQGRMMQGFGERRGPRGRGPAAQ
jgi:protein CpxP